MQSASLPALSMGASAGRGTPVAAKPTGAAVSFSAVCGSPAPGNSLVAEQMAEAAAARSIGHTRAGALPASRQPAHSQRVAHARTCSPAHTVAVRGLCWCGRHAAAAAAAYGTCARVRSACMRSLARSLHACRARASAGAATPARSLRAGPAMRAASCLAHSACERHRCSCCRGLVRLQACQTPAPVMLLAAVWSAACARCWLLRDRLCRCLLLPVGCRADCCLVGCAAAGCCNSHASSACRGGKKLLPSKCQPTGWHRVALANQVPCLPMHSATRWWRCCIMVQVHSSWMSAARLAAT